MEMQVTRDWLRQKIASLPDLDADAGTPVGVLESIGMFMTPEIFDQENEKGPRAKEAFGVLVRQLRRRDRITVSELAEKARVEEEEVRRIERDPDYLPRPRTVHQLADVFRLSERALMKLSGATVANDQGFEEEALRFAARSDDLSKLTTEEQRALNEYVKYLNDEDI